MSLFRSRERDAPHLITYMVAGTIAVYLFVPELFQMVTAGFFGLVDTVIAQVEAVR